MNGNRLYHQNIHMQKTGELLQHIIEEARTKLLTLEEERVAQPIAAGKWSPKQIIGHLIDSASNNHQRFVRAQFTDDLIFPGYRQEEWVVLQEYDSADWQNLVQLWYYFNWQIARVMDITPESKLNMLRPQHNLHQIAMYTIPAEEPATLVYFMLDYVKHLENHLKQIFPEYEKLS